VGLTGGTYWWTARAIDVWGGQSEWALSASFVVGEDDSSRESPGDTDDVMDLDKVAAGCGCAVEGGVGGLWVLLPLLIFCRRLG
ncbi:MAG: hypothetical protein HN348_32490, partial [Proteobacteria bacterium]|nr:hypothetical protein [Pseudomonadota bacterium]